MNPATQLAFVLIAFLGILAFVLVDNKKKSKEIKNHQEIEKKNHLYLISFFKEIQASIVSVNDLEHVIGVITNNLEKNYPYSTLSSGVVKGSKLIFKSVIKEPVSRAYIDTIKNNMLTTTDKKDAEESLTGVAINELISTSINSTADIKLVLDGQTVGIVNLSSTAHALYTETNLYVFSTLGELVSDMLTKLKSLIWFEKAKSLAMIDSFSEGIFLVDKNTDLLAINDSAQNILSIHKERPTMNDVFSTLPNTYNFKDKIDQVMREKTLMQEKDVAIKDKIFNIIISPVMDVKTKDLIGVSVLLHDITLEKSLSQMKKDFTNVMVHELRSPLTAIRASSEFLTSKADLTVEEKNKLTQMISDSSKKMLDEISLILDSAKMDAGLFIIRKTDADIKKLITDRVAVFTPIAQEKTISITLDLDPDLGNFAFDQTRIDEVINNLLSNSLKFTPAQGNIHISAHKVDGKVVVSVKDTGAGIPKDKQHLLFAKFQQAPSDGEHQGTGLGLYVVKGVVEAHGGTVGLESDIGKGTKISFTLPIERVAKTDLHAQELTPIKPPNPMAN